jgi:hypothetical protein
MLSGQNWVLLQACLGVTLVLAAGYIGYYVVKYLRGATSKDDTSTGDLTLNFEEMRREGDISEAEFRTIQTVLGKTQSSGPNCDHRSN